MNNEQAAALAVVGTFTIFFVFWAIWKIAGQVYAKKAVAQQHLVATEELIAGILKHADGEGQLLQAKELFVKARNRQGDGTVRVGHVTWVLLTLDGTTDESPPIY